MGNRMLLLRYIKSSDLKENEMNSDNGINKNLSLIALINEQIIVIIAVDNKKDATVWLVFFRKHSLA